MNYLTRLRNSFTVILGIIACNAAAQILPDSTIKNIDQLFISWGEINKPGYAIGIVRNDSLIYAKGYGFANLEYAIPNSPETIFHMASVSKQFTAYCILLLERQGKLSLDDDVRQYLPWFPDLKHKINIRHLLNHTSGIRDQWDLVRLSGRRMDDVITQEHIISLLKRQQALNFIPGEKFSYSNSNYSMLAEIVKEISGQPFRQFADSAIFKPLGMTSTHVHDSHTEIVPNRTYSYRPLDATRFAHDVLNYANSGATSLFTNISDMAKWVMNFWHPKVGDAALLDRLTTRGKLTNGQEIDYASGIFNDVYKGKKRYQHSGADAGYRTMVSIFPEKKIGLIVFSNLAVANSYQKANELADVFFKSVPKEPKPEIDSSLAIFNDTTALVNSMGNYISKEDGVLFSYYIKDQKVHWVSPVSTYLLAKGEGDTLFRVGDPEVKFVFNNKNPDNIYVDGYWPGSHRRLMKYTPQQLSTHQLEKALKEYEGVYYSPELDKKYSCTIAKNKLTFSNDEATVSPEYIRKDMFSISRYFVRFTRDTKNQITGYELNTGRSNNIKFTKIAPTPSR